MNKGKSLKDVSQDKAVHGKIAKNSGSAIVLAVVLFIATFLIYFILENTVVANPSEISDWHFICGETAENIEGNISSYYKANSENKIAKKFGKPYVRLHYTLTTDEEPMRFVIRTNNNPIRIELNGKEVLDNGYTAKNSFTGNAYNEVVLDANMESTVDVYLYAPMAFSIHAFVESGSSAVLGSFVRGLGFAFSTAAVVSGVLMLILMLVLSPGSKNSVQLLLLSITIIAGGALGALYAILENSDLLVSPLWYCLRLMLQMLLMILMYVTILSCYGEAVKKAAVFIPVLIIGAVVLIFPIHWVIRVIAVLFAVAQVYIAVCAGNALANAKGDDVPHVGAIRGLLLYAALINLFNTFCLFAGIGVMNFEVYFYSIILFCMVTYVVFCRQVIYRNLQKIEQDKQFHADRVWIEDVTSLISEMFMDKGMTTFLMETAKKLARILSKNAKTPEEDAEIHVSVGILDSGAISEIYNSGGVESCDYKEVSNYLLTKEKKFSVGGKTADMLFFSDGCGALMHFENVTGQITPMLENIINAAYPKLAIAYQNVSMRDNMENMQEELFINLAAIIEEKDKNTQLHQTIVSALTYQVCLFLGMPEEKAKTVSIASLTHDIGKIVLPEYLLQKKGKFTDEEYNLVKEHVVFGRNILALRSGYFFEEAAKIAEQHHENYDGTGYLGIRGRDIATNARIVRVIDTMDALLSERSYKKAWAPEQVYEYILDNKGKLFDPTVASTVAQHFNELIEMRNSIVVGEGIK